MDINISLVWQLVLKSMDRFTRRKAVLCLRLVCKQLRFLVNKFHRQSVPIQEVPRFIEACQKNNQFPAKLYVFGCSSLKPVSLEPPLINLLGFGDALQELHISCRFLRYPMLLPQTLTKLILEDRKYCIPLSHLTRLDKLTFIQTTEVVERFLKSDDFPQSLRILRLFENWNVGMDYTIDLRDLEHLKELQLTNIFIHNIGLPKSLEHIHINEYDFSAILNDRNIDWDKLVFTNQKLSQTSMGRIITSLSAVSCIPNTLLTWLISRPESQEEDIQLCIEKYSSLVNKVVETVHPLDVAFFTKRIKIFELLLRYPIPKKYLNRTLFYTCINCTNDFQPSKGSMEPNITFVRLLLKHGADVNAMGAENMQLVFPPTLVDVTETPLFMAIRGGLFETALCLLKNGADINIHKGDTPIFVLLIFFLRNWGEVDCFHELLEVFIAKGPNFEEKYLNLYPIDICVLTKCRLMVNALLENKHLIPVCYASGILKPLIQDALPDLPIEYVDNQNSIGIQLKGFLIQLMDWNNSVAFKFLLDFYREELVQDSSVLQDLLIISILKIQSNFTDILLESGLNPNFYHPDHGTPLECAIHGGEEIMVSRLINYGANIDFFDARMTRTHLEFSLVTMPKTNPIFSQNYGQTMNEMASQDKKITPTQLRVLITREKKNSLFHLACYELSHQKYFKNLLDLGFDPTLRNAKGVGVLDIIAQTRNLELFTLFLEYIEKYQQQSQESDPIIYEDPDVFYSADPKGRTWVHHLCKAESNTQTYLMFEAFQQHGFKINFDRQTNDGTTPLMIAAQKGDYTLVQYITKHLVNLNLRNSRGETALWLACKYHHNDIIYCLNVLEADCTIVDHEYGLTPLFILSEWGNMPALNGFIGHAMYCDQDRKNNAGKTALHIAVENMNYAVITKLLFSFDTLEITFDIVLNTRFNLLALSQKSIAEITLDAPLLCFKELILTIIQVVQLLQTQGARTMEEDLGTNFYEIRLVSD